MRQINPIPIIEDVVDAVPGIPVSIPGPDDLVAGIAESLLDGFFETLSNAMTGAAIKMNELVFGMLSSSTAIDLSTLSGNQTLQTTTAIGITMVLAFFFASIVRGLVRGEYSALLRAALFDVPMAIVGTLGLVTFAQMLLGITDAATAAILGDAATNLGEGQIAVLTSPEAVLNGGMIAGLLALVYIVAALLTWMWLFLRAALIYFIVAAAPLGIATRAYPPAAVFARRTIEMGIALIVSKFFLALALSVGAEQFAGAEGDLSAMAVGAGTMVLAAFMPSVVIKLIPIAEGATSSSGVERAPLRMAAAGAGMAIGGAAMMGGAAPGGAGGGTGIAGPSNPQPPAPGGTSGSAGGSGSGGKPGGGSSGEAGGSGDSGTNKDNGNGSSGSGASGGAGGTGGSGSSGSSGTPGPAGADGNSSGSTGSGSSGVNVVSMGSGGIGTVAGSRGETSGSFGDLDS